MTLSTSIEANRIPGTSGRSADLNAFCVKNIGDAQISPGPGAGEEARCPSCGGSERRLWGRRDNHRILKCGECELLYFERPIIQPYDYQEYYPYLRDFDALRFDWELAVRKRKFERQLRKLRRLAPGATTLLDVGAGPGYFCRAAMDAGYEAIGVELSAEARRVGTAHFMVDYMELDAVTDRSVDIITCHHVLEHIEWPQDFLANLRAKLRAGGILAIHVPHQQPLSFLIRDYLGRGGDTHCSLYYPIHVNGFTCRSLARAVERQAFHSISVVSASMWSVHYDPFFLRNYFRSGQPVLKSAQRAATHAARCVVDVLGNSIGRGDWVIGHFRAV